MKQLLIYCSLMLLAGAGCVSKSKADAQARAAYLAGQNQGLSMAAQGPSVWVIGNVKTPVVPWTQDLTLAKALIAAEYQGTKDPREIVVQHKGMEPLHLRAQQLLEGQDMPLQAGDRVEIRP